MSSKTKVICLSFESLEFATLMLNVATFVNMFNWNRGVLQNACLASETHATSLPELSSCLTFTSATSLLCFLSEYLVKNIHHISVLYFMELP